MGGEGRREGRSGEAESRYIAHMYRQYISIVRHYSVYVCICISGNEPMPMLCSTSSRCTAEGLTFVQ